MTNRLSICPVYTILYYVYLICRTPQVFRTYWLLNDASRHSSLPLCDIDTPKKRPKAFMLLTCSRANDASCHSGVPLLNIVTPKKWSRNVVLCAFWLANALRRITVPFFHIRTSKNGLKPSVVQDFELQMRFALQRRAIFHFSSAHIGCAPAALASLLLDPPDPRISAKNIAIRDFPNILRTLVFFLLSSFFWLFLFLGFSSLHIVGSLTSKLPSINHVKYMNVNVHTDVSIIHEL